MAWIAGRFFTNQTPVPSNACPHFGHGGGKPRNTTAPAKTGNADTLDVAAIRTSPRNRCSNITQDLGIGGFRNNIAKNFGYGSIGIVITCSNKKFGGNGEVTQLRKTAGDVRNVFMDTKNLAAHNHDRQWSFGFFRT
jgi:hypothetical protein